MNKKQIEDINKELPYNLKNKLLKESIENVVLTLTKEKKNSKKK